MQKYNQAEELLKILDRPAFAVSDGTVILANDAALQRQVKIGTQIDTILLTGKEAYSTFTDGRLHLRLSIEDSVWEASVTKAMDVDLFLMERSVNEQELQIMSLAAMQLRTPLSELMALTNQLFREESIKDPVLLAKLNRSLLSMQRLVGNMADAPRYSNSANYMMQTRNVNAYIRELMEKSQHLLEKAGYTLSYTAPEEEIFALVSTERLERAIYNLLSNAMKFSPVGSSISVRLEKCKEKLMLTVTDEGNGLTNKVCENVFTRYLREPAIEDSRVGMGLGMLYVCAAASAHGGTVLLRQPEGKGLSVTMTLSIKNNPPGMFHSDIFPIDYSGGRDHALLELSDVLPSELYE
ncbi:MAG: HAMP domain-containing histidine kinase [Ruminococcaceae bacterium]|nr:HAMP domain-containing histidine kinase [Oscillospiraceae bacterium]